MLPATCYRTIKPLIRKTILCCLLGVREQYGIFAGVDDQTGLLLFFSPPLHWVLGRTLVPGCWEQTHTPRGSWEAKPALCASWPRSGCVPALHGAGESVGLQVYGGGENRQTRHVFHIFL